MRQNLRHLWTRLHRWTALSLGWLLVLAALLGSLLTLAKPLDQWAHPELFRQQGMQGPQLQPVLVRLQQEFGPGTDFTFRPPRRPHDSLWVYAHGTWDGVLYFDEAGRELGRRGESDGAYNLLFELHSSLLLGDTGKAILTTAAGCYLLLLVSGLVLWWPRRSPPSFRVHWRAPVLRSALELHNVLGVLLGLAIAVSVASGAYMAWPPLRSFVTQLSGAAPVKPPQPGAAPAVSIPTLDTLVNEAAAVFPQGMVGYVQVPGRSTMPVRVRLKLPDDPHPNGLSSVWLHPATGDVLKVIRWSDLDAGNRLVATVYPLHIGSLGGPLHEVLVGLTGLALATLGGSGLLLWWKRRILKTRPSRGNRLVQHFHPMANGQPRSTLKVRDATDVGRDDGRR